MNRKLLLLWISPMLVVACAPLMQAPLVYTSGFTVGVSATSNVADNGSVGVVIGVKQLDMAYVPVAVARPCPNATASTCSGSTYDIVSLRGNNNQDDNSDVGPETLALLRRQLDLARSALSRADGERETAQREADRQPRKIAASAPPDQSGPVPQIDNPAFLNAMKTLESRLAAQAAAKATYAQAQSDFDKIAGRNASSKTTGRGDSYSVFGTFDADTRTESKAPETQSGVPAATGGIPSVGLNLGKVFSTGIASQMLTEGMRAHYTAVAAATCVEKITALLGSVPEADRKALFPVVAELSKRCGQSPTLAMETGK